MGGRGRGRGWWKKKKKKMGKKKDVRWLEKKRDKARNEGEPRRGTGVAQANQTEAVCFRWLGIITLLSRGSDPIS